MHILSSVFENITEKDYKKEQGRYFYILCSLCHPYLNDIAAQLRFFFLSPLGGAGLKEYEKPITAVMLACVLSALRLCVWLSNNGYIQLLYMNERFLFTFWTEQGEIP